MLPFALVIAEAAPGGGIWDGFAGTLLQSCLLLGGAAWGYFLYRKRREFRSRIRVGVTARVSRPTSRPARLFVRLHMVNECSGQVDITAKVVVWSVTTEANAFPAFDKATELADFPLDYAYGEITQAGVMADEDGNVGTYPLEPLECIETECLFCPDPLPDLMALRASMEEERSFRDWRTGWRRKRFETTRWETFAYIDPTILTGSEYVALSSHEAVG